MKENSNSKLKWLVVGAALFTLVAGVAVMVGMHIRKRMESVNDTFNFDDDFYSEKFYTDDSELDEQYYQPDPIDDLLDNSDIHAEQDGLDK